MRENVAKQTGAQDDEQHHAGEAYGFHADRHLPQAGQDIDHHSLSKTAHPARARLAEHRCRARCCRADKVAVQDAEIALPDRSNAVEDRHEQYALSQDPGRKDVEIGNTLDGKAAYLCHHLPEQREHGHRLDSARDQLERIVPELLHFGGADPEDLPQIGCRARVPVRRASEQRGVIPGHRDSSLSRGFARPQ